jgi:hypothetical protein
MRFSQSEQLSLPCTFERFVPGKPHPDGRRYLPLIVLRLPHPSAAGETTPVESIGVVDRHHVVDPALAGQSGVAKLVFLLSTVRLQQGSQRTGLQDEEQPAPRRASMAPIAYGRVVAVPSWEAEQRHLPYEALYAELLLDIGAGVVGVRTSVTAASLAETIGKQRLEPGDWLEVRRSRIDILEFKI